MFRTVCIKHPSFYASSFTIAHRGILLIITVLLISGQVKATGAPGAEASKLLPDATQSNMQASITRSDQWGLGTDQPVPGDYDGDDKTDLAVFRPSLGCWYILNSSDNAFRGQHFGILTDQPVPADYDGDGKTDIAVFRAGSGSWYILQSSNNTFRGQSWGTMGDLPSPGDYDGDGKSDLAVFRPSTGNWYILQSISNSFRTFSWGKAGDVPVNADYDGDGKMDASVFRPSNGTFYSWLSSDNSFPTQQWGISTDRPVTGDFDKDGKADHCVFRPSDATWYVLKSSDNTMFAQPWGQGADRLVPQDYDGNGQADIAAFSSSGGIWNILLNPVPSPSPSQNVVSYPTAISNLSTTPSKSVYYRFSETSGTSIADVSGGSHTGTFTVGSIAGGTITLNQTSLLTGDSNPSALFDGGKVTSTNFMPVLTTGLSMAVLFQPSAWPNGVSARYDIVALGTSSTNGYFTLTYQNNANVFSYYFVDTSGGGNTFLFPALQGTQQLNRTYHVAVTHDFASKTVKLYLDGLLVSTQTYTTTPRTVINQPIRVGFDNVHGYIDEALVTGDRVLTGTEVRSLARAAVGADQGATEFYVSTTGSYRNPGTSASPLDIYTALRSGLAAPGQTYWLKGGTYNAPAAGLYSYLIGASGNPVRVKEVVGERAIIDEVNVPLGAVDAENSPEIKGFTIEGSNVEYWNFEVTNSNPGSNNRRESRPTGIDIITALNLKFIGVILYDTGVGVFKGTGAVNVEFHSCLLFNNGWWRMVSGQPESAGHNFYIQNNPGRMLVKNSVSWGAASLGFHVYGTGTFMTGIDVQNSVFFMNNIWHNTTSGSGGVFFGGARRINDSTITNNVAYAQTGRLGLNYTVGQMGDPHEHMTFTGNKSFGSRGLQFNDYAHVTVSNNLFIDTRSSVGDANHRYFGYIRPADYSGLDPSSNNYDVDHAYSYGGLKGDWTGTGNTYAGAGYSSSKQIWFEEGVSGYNLASWQSLTNIDSDATIRNTTTTPYTSPLVYYFPNAYETGNGFVAVYNAPASSTASIDLSQFGYVVGQTYTIRDVMNPFVDLATGTYSGSPVSVSMTGTTVRVPIGYGIAGTPSSRTSSEFKTFVVIPSAGR